MSKVGVDDEKDGAKSKHIRSFLNIPRPENF